MSLVPHALAVVEELKKLGYDGYVIENEEAVVLYVVSWHGRTLGRNVATMAGKAPLEAALEVVAVMEPPAPWEARPTGKVPKKREE